MPASRSREQGGLLGEDARSFGTRKQQGCRQAGTARHGTAGMKTKARGCVDGSCAMRFQRLLLTLTLFLLVHSSRHIVPLARAEASPAAAATSHFSFHIGFGWWFTPPPSEPPECPPPPPPPCPPLPSPPPPSPPPPSPPPPPPSPPPPPPSPPPPPPSPPPPSPPPPSPPPPSPPPPPPSPPPRPRSPPRFENLKQKKAYLVIQRFRKTVTSDPKGITKTWRGPKVCNYKGFYCGTPPKTKDRTIASIDFNGYNIGAPTISGFVDGLPDLALFHANTNNFSGTVPDLTKLQYLYELDVSNNLLSGPFPSEVLRLRQLDFLDIRYNTFSGALPPQVFSLNVAVLFLNNNPFSQPLPYELGNTNASYITLANNGFTGSIPATIGKAADFIIEILFLNNRLSGCLPYEIGLLKKATVFDAGDNQITGTIPLSFGCLEKVEQLNLANNNLYGPVPDVLCRLPRLLNLSLSGNYFTSLGLSCWELVHNGVLDLRGNCIPSLPMQKSLWECYSFAVRPKIFCPPIFYIPCDLHQEFAVVPGSVEAAPQALAPDPTETAPAPSPTYTALHRLGT